MAAARQRTRAAPPATGRFACLDGYRGLAAIAVVVTHVSFITATNRHGTSGQLLARLDAGVAVFFVLSGFLLYRPLVVRHLDGSQGPSLRSYARRRFLRIFPACWVALTVSILLLPASQRPALGEMVRYYTLTHIYWPSTVLGPVDQAWSLGTEIAFYAFLPLYALLVATAARRRGTSAVRAEVVGVISLFVAAQMFRLLFVVPAATLTQRSLVTWLPNNLDLFALGMGLAVLHAWCEHRADRPPLALDRAWAPSVYWLVAAAAFWLVSTRCNIPVMAIDFAGPQLFARQLLYGLTAIALIAPGVFGDAHAGIIRPVLASWPLRSLGAISYGIYLWHQMVKSQYIERSDTQIFTGGFLPMLVAVLAVTIVIATLSWIVIERPALSRRSTTGRASAV